MPDSAASMLNPRPADAAPKAGGSIRVVVRRLFKIPMRLRVGERPAGAERLPPFLARVSTLIGDLAASTFRGLVIGVAVALTDENVGEGGARVRKKFVTGLQSVSFAEPSGHFDRLGERKITGSIFSESSLLKSDS